MTKFKHTLIFALLFLFSFPLFASHIVGGGITYQCIGSNGNNRTYRFTMKVYRDCLNGQAAFDQQANIAIHRGTYQSSVLNSSFTVTRGPVVDVSINQPDCIDNLPILCLEEATYTWERTLPISNDSYFVVYQRCCRTDAIANILIPGDTGATYFVEITPEAQTLCNSSPVFNNFPPVVICNNYPLEVDYSVTDPDGDQLVYSFCAPFAGGGPPGSGFGCFATAPSPPCPPPFTEVNFIAPFYSPSQPMAGNPIIKINAQSGLISGTPHLNGQFVVGVCVQEFRNGVLLSTTRRDFQFNVAACAPQVTALVQYDELAGPQQYVIKNCSDSKTVTIINESTSANLSDFLWVFDLHNGNIIQNSTDFDLTIDFPDFGTYNGMLLLNNGLDCGDTAFIRVELHPPSMLDLGADVKICKDSSVLLDAGAGFTAYEWQDGSTARTFTATTSGVFHVATTDSCGTVLRDSVNIIISPVPGVSLADVSLCPGESVSFDVLGFDLYNWAPSTGLNCTDCANLILSPSATTTYTFSGTNQDGCVALDTFTATVLPTPMRTYTIQFYPNQSVTLGGQTYTQSGTVILDVASTSGGCDSLNTYILELLPTTLTIQCPANLTVAMANNATTTAVDYALPMATTDCPGTPPSIQRTQGLASGANFPAGLNTVCYEASNTCGDNSACCFTVMVTTLGIQCPPSQTVDLPVATTTVPVDYAAPTTMGNCPSPASVTQLQGLPSGGAFPQGTTQVCYQATNTCGNQASCCFNVTVIASPPACDIKTIGCFKFELLDIRLDSIKQPRYRIRVTNYCDSEVNYVVIQLPNGVVAVTPVEASTYTAPGTGNQYAVRTPNASPFYSVRYKSISTSIKGGESEVFEYRLPQQSLPVYIHIAGKLKNGVYSEAHLNTFYCPVQPWAGSRPSEFGIGSEEFGIENAEFGVRNSGELAVYPNPTDGKLWVDVSEWQGKTVHAQVLNAQGQLVLNHRYEVERELLELDFDSRLANGLYYLVVQPVGGERATVKFMLAH